MKKTAVITGASSGMGKEMVYELSDRFRSIEEIWVIARRRERLEALEGQVTARIRIFALDITDRTERKKLETAFREEKPDIRFLVNGAGWGVTGKTGEIPTEEETGMIDLNCEALCAVTHMALPYMAKNSRILLFASAAAFLPQPGFAVYAATKAFVLSYSRALKEELKDRGIVVTAVCPGPVKTEFFNRPGMKEKLPFYKRLVMARPEKVVRKAVTDSCGGRSLSVYGIGMKAFFLLSRTIPHGAILKLMEMAGPKGPARSGLEERQNEEQRKK